MMMPANNYGTYTAEVRDLFFSVKPHRRLIRAMERLQKNDDDGSMRVKHALANGPILTGTRIRCGKVDVTFYANSLS